MAGYDHEEEVDRRLAGPATDTTTNSGLLTTQTSLIETLCSFLTVSIHQLLYLRSIYPQVSFLSARAYNFPVRQSRHPAVCRWINSAVSAIQDQLSKNTVNKVFLCIYDVQANAVLERWTFDLRDFPVVETADADIPFDPARRDKVNSVRWDQPLKNQVQVTNQEAQLRAVLSRLSATSARLTPLATDREQSFTVGIETRDRADRPVGRLEKEERKWIAAESQPGSNADATGISDALPVPSAISQRMGKTNKVHAVRKVDVGELSMEIWVEEANEKLTPSSTTSEFKEG